MWLLFVGCLFGVESVKCVSGVVLEWTGAFFNVLVDFGLGPPPRRNYLTENFQPLEIFSECFYGGVSPNHEWE